jgi:hypothetical protein
MTQDQLIASARADLLDELRRATGINGLVKTR